MKNNKVYLNEERYLKTKNKITLGAVIVLVIGLLIGGSLITTGIIKIQKNNYKYSDKYKDLVNEKIGSERKILQDKKKVLEDKGLTYSPFISYDKGEEYDLKVITDVLNPSFDYCLSDEYKNNYLTKDYCAYKNELKELNSFNKEFDSFESIPLFMIGGFIIIATLMISGSIYLSTKRREMLAYQAQQIMPVGKEIIEEVAPTVGKAGSAIAKEMAPAYGEIAKEISKGIKEGLNKDNK